MGAAISFLGKGKGDENNKDKMVVPYSGVLRVGDRCAVEWLYG